MPRVLIYIVCDRLADPIADLDRTRIVHSTPYPGVVSIRPCLQNARVRAIGLTGSRQRKGLPGWEVAEEDRRSGAVEAGMSGRVFRMRRRIDER